MRCEEKEGEGRVLLKATMMCWVSVVLHSRR